MTPSKPPSARKKGKDKSPASTKPIREPVSTTSPAPTGANVAATPSKKSKSTTRAKSPKKAHSTPPSSVPATASPSANLMNSGSPTVVLNPRMTPGKLRLLDSSPMRNLLSLSERNAAAAEVTSGTADSTEKEKVRKVISKVKKSGNGKRDERIAPSAGANTEDKAVLEGVLKTGKKVTGKKRVSFASEPQKAGWKGIDPVCQVLMGRKRSGQRIKRAIYEAENEKGLRGDSGQPKSTTDVVAENVASGKSDAAAMKSMVQAITQDSNGSDGDDDMDDQVDVASIDVDVAMKPLPAKHDHRDVKKFKNSKPKSDRKLLRKGLASVESNVDGGEGDEGKAGKSSAEADGKDKTSGKDRRKGSRRTKESDSEMEDIDPHSTGGVIYIGHVPHGFYEKQMWSYFSQFGKVLRVRVSRSKRTGKSRGYAFVLFADADVAVIAAEAMDGYLMEGRRLVAKFMPKDKVHEKLFKPRTKAVSPQSFSIRDRAKIMTRSKDPAKVAERSKKIMKAMKSKRQRLAKLNIVYKYPTVTHPTVATVEMPHQSVATA